MMPAVKHLDPVLGVDIHLIIPPGAPPVPIPHPHIGMVFDPFDYLPVIGATVKVNGLPRAQAGTGGIGIPPHFPIGGTFLKPPGNDNETFMGSATVAVDGDAFTHMTLPVLSCQDIGMPRPPRKGKGGARSLLLPTTVALSIPAGPPVRVGGPPTISLMGMAEQLMLGALLKGLKKLRKLQKASRKMKAMSDRVHRAASKAMDALKVGPRARNRVHKALCTLTGHPVDVVTGRVVTTAVDWALPGPLPLRFERNYASSWGGRDSVLGHGWSHSLDLAVWEEDGRVVYRPEDGREIEFDTRALPRRRMQAGMELYEPIDRLTLRHVSELRWEVQTAEGLTHELRPVIAGGPCRVVRTRNRAGHAIAYAYDARGLLETVVDCAGRHLRFEHDAKGRLVRTWLPHPTQPGLLPYNRYVYSEAGDLVEAWDALEQPFRYAYADHLLVRETNRNGLTFHFEYDGQGPQAWCLRTWGDGGIYDHRLRYDTQRHLTEVTNSLGDTTTYFADGRGVVVAKVDALGGEWRYEYDEALRRTAERDAMGHVTRFEYDARGNRTRIAEADKAELTFEYDERGLVVRGTDELGGPWRWERNRQGEVIARTNPLGECTRYEWQGGLPVAILDPAGARTELHHDRELNLARLVEPGGVETSYTHDRWGRLTHVRRSDGASWRIQYDLGDRPVLIEAPDGDVQRFAHDAEGNLLEETGAGARLRYAYTGFHWLARVDDAGDAVHVEYDTEGRMLGIRNELGEVYRLVRDERGDVVEEHGFDGGVRRYERDLLGHVRRLHRASGATVEMDYDEVGQLVEVRYADGAKERFAYRADGRLMVAENAAARVELERDAVGRIVTEASNVSQVYSRYDARGDRVALRSSHGLEGTFTYDLAGRTKALIVKTEQGSRRLDLLHHALERRAERRFPGGVTQQWSWDALGQTRRSEVLHASGATRAREYLWAPGSRLVELWDSVQGRSRFQHDARSRLTAAHLPSGRAEYRLQDAAGNLYRRGDRQDRTHGRGNRLEQCEGARLEYDADGNLVRRVLPDGSVWRYAYDGAGFLKEVLRPDGKTVCFTYDALGRRIRKQFGEREVLWVWDGDVLLHELGVASAPRSWVHVPGELTPSVKLEGDAFYSLLHDHLETPEALYDEEGRQVWQASAEPYRAVEVELDQSPCPWRWPGQYEDAETGLYYNRFRYYDPSAGRYISQDPSGVDGGLNLYAYVSDPLVMVDPLGLDWNYVLVDATGKPYYSGRASDNTTEAAVKARHANTEGKGDGVRFSKENKDKLVRITPVNTDPSVVRGIEQLAMEKNDTNIGRRKVNGDCVRGNNIRGVNPKKKKGYLEAAREYLSKHQVNHCS